VREGENMNKYRVTIKYGDPGKYKHSSTTVDVEAESDSTAMRLAESKFKKAVATLKAKFLGKVQHRG